MPTPAKEGADRLDATNTVDLDETARLAESLVRDGATGIMALGTMGECATTSQSDYEAYVDCLLKTVRGRIVIASVFHTFYEVLSPLITVHVDGAIAAVEANGASSAALSFGGRLRCSRR